MPWQVRFPPCSEREREREKSKKRETFCVRGIVPFPWKTQPSSHLTSVLIPSEKKKNSFFIFLLCWILFMDSYLYTQTDPEKKIIHPWCVPPSGPSGIEPPCLSWWLLRKKNVNPPSILNKSKKVIIIWMRVIITAGYSFVWKHRSTSITDKHMFRTCFLKLENNRNGIAWGLGRRKTTRNGFDQGAVVQVVGGTCSPWEWTMSSSHITKPLTYPVFFFLFPFCLLMGERRGVQQHMFFWGVCLCTCHDEEHHEKVAPTKKKKKKMECLFFFFAFSESSQRNRDKPGQLPRFRRSLCHPPLFGILCVFVYLSQWHWHSRVPNAVERRSSSSSFDSIPKLTPTRVEIIQQQGKVTIITRPTLPNTFCGCKIRFKPQFAWELERIDVLKRKRNRAQGCRRGCAFSNAETDRPSMFYDNSFRSEIFRFFFFFCLRSSLIFKVISWGSHLNVVGSNNNASSGWTLLHHNQLKE